MSARARAALLLLLVLLPLQAGGVARALAQRRVDNPAKDRATFGIGPASFGRVDPRSYFSYQTGPGGSYHDQAAVLNFGSAPLHLSVYVADLGNGADGSIVAGLATDKPHDAGAWLSIPKQFSTVNVPARTAAGPGKVIIPLALHVPGDASPGDHGGALIAVLSTIGKDPRGQNVRLDQRVASRVYVRVRGAVRAQLTVVGLSSRYHQASLPWGRGHVTVTYTVRNTGNVRLDVDQLVKAGTWFSSGHKTTPPNIPLLFPGAQQKVTVDVARIVPTIFGSATVTLSPHLFTDQPPQRLLRTSAHTSFLAIPWLLILIVVLAVVAYVGYRRYQRHRRNRPTDPTPTPAAVAPVPSAPAAAVPVVAEESPVPTPAPLPRPVEVAPAPAPVPVAHVALAQAEPEPPLFTEVASAALASAGEPEGSGGAATAPAALDPLTAPLDVLIGSSSHEGAPASVDTTSPGTDQPPAPETLA